MMLLLTSITAPIFVTQTAHADPFSGSKTQACQGISTGNSNPCGQSGGLDSIIKTIVDLLSVIVGIAAVIMIIVAGLKFVTSGGDANKAASARNTLIYALAGLTVAALAQILVHFVLGNVK